MLNEPLPSPLLTSALPDGLRSRFVDNVNGLRMHVLEAGFDTPNRPRLLLLHGFPELAYSWRHIMQPLAEAGYHVIAPDQRGYGRTTGWDPSYDGDLTPFGLMNLVRDTVALIHGMGFSSVEAVVGHDFGSHVAAHCALIRPDVFQSMVLMSAPYSGPPSFETNNSPASQGSHLRPKAAPNIDDALAALPQPRKHYQLYYCTRQANHNMLHCPQGLSDFLRAYFHYKSADWKENSPYELKAWNAEELAKMPTYYIMNKNDGMAEAVFDFMPSKAVVSSCTWLSNEDLTIYVQEFSRTGFQGGLQWYRNTFSERQRHELQLFANRRIDVPACFIAGNKDWGTYQRPGVVAIMQQQACSNMMGFHLVDNAGHWVQQEQPLTVTRLLKDFLNKL